MVDPCPLCGDRAASARASYSYARAFAALRDRFGPSITAELESRYSPEPEARLHECHSCGLWYFSPANAGGPDFYDALARSDRYYGVHRWEYGIALDLLSPGATVLDVGCGRGDFLAGARDRGASVMAAETNPEAMAHLRARAIPNHAGTLATLDQRCDLVCAFQVLEHLPSALELASSMAARLAPGGRMLVSVPNRERLSALGQLEPLDMPPHHVSRWSPAQLLWLGERLGLELVAIRVQRRAPRAAAKVVYHRLRRGVVGLVPGSTEPGPVATITRATLGNTVLAHYRLAH